MQQGRVEKIGLKRQHFSAMPAAISHAPQHSSGEIRNDGKNPKTDRADSRA